MSSLSKAPKVGVGVILLRDGQVLLGQRVGAHGVGTWALPGGHLDFGESVEACAVREVLEETGLEVTDVFIGPYTNDVFVAEDKHYITLFVLAQCEGEPALLEPDKCLGWEWFFWENLPQPLFLPLANLVATGFVPETHTFSSPRGQS